MGSWSGLLGQQFPTEAPGQGLVTLQHDSCVPDCSGSQKKSLEQAERGPRLGGELRGGSWQLQGVSFPGPAGGQQLETRPRPQDQRVA